MIVSIRIGAILLLVCGVVAQFVQRTDPVFPMWYFTIDSAILATAVVAGSLLGSDRSRVPHWVAGGATVGVVLSAVVFAAVIAPASPSGGWFNAHDDMWARLATLLLHGAAPIAVVLAYATTPYTTRPSWFHALQFLWWPLSYFIVITALAHLQLATVPYPFLDLSLNRWASVLGATAVLALTTTVVGLLVVAMRRLWGSTTLR